MGVGASTLGVVARVNLTVGCAMDDTTLGDVGCTLGTLGGFCGSGAGGIGACGWGKQRVCGLLRWGEERLLEKNAC
jgi:hypothetical protein